MYKNNENLLQFLNLEMLLLLLWNTYSISLLGNIPTIFHYITLIYWYNQLHIFCSFFFSSSFFYTLYCIHSYQHTNYKIQFQLQQMNEIADSFNSYLMLMYIRVAKRNDVAHVNFANLQHFFLLFWFSCIYITCVKMVIYVLFATPY